MVARQAIIHPYIPVVNGLQKSRDKQECQFSHITSHVCHTNPSCVRQLKDRQQYTGAYEHVCYTSLRGKRGQPPFPSHIFYQVPQKKLFFKKNMHTYTFMLKPIVNAGKLRVYV